MNKLITLIIIVCTASVNAQNLSIKDLVNICNKNSWETANGILVNKGWRFHNSSTWSFEKSYYDDKAEGWFSFYDSEDGVSKVVNLKFFDKTYYTRLYNSLNSNGFKFDRNRIYDGTVISEYSNSDFELTITTQAREDDEYRNTTIETYTFFLQKKMSDDFLHNGPQVEYFEDDNSVIEREYNLKNDKYDGKYIEYFPNGKPSIVANYKNDKAEGAYASYYFSGQLEMKGNYVDDKGNGLFVWYYEDGSKNEEYTEVNDEKNGLYTSYRYLDDTSLKPNSKETVNYLNGQKNGIERFIYMDGAKEVVVSYCTYVKGVKEGKMQQFHNDSVVFCSFLNDKLHGDYKIYYKENNLLFNKIPIIDTAQQTLIMAGNYNYGEMNGLWKVYDLNGQLRKKFSYKNNHREGEWVEYVQDCTNYDQEAKEHVGTILNKFNYVNGELDGTCESFGENVEYYVKCDKQYDVKSEKNDSCVAISFIPFRLIENFKNGKLQGETKKFDKDNNLVLECNYEQDELNGEWFKKNEGYYEKGSYKNGLKTGKWTYYTLDNKLFSEEEYIQDKLEGDRSSYDISGNKIYIQKYKNDAFQNGVYYNEKHQIISEVRRENENVLQITTYNNDFIIKTTYKIFCDIQKYKYENIKEKSNELIQNKDLIKNGKYYMRREGKMECEGEYLLGKKQGIWSYKYLQEGVVNNLGYNNGILTNETFQELKNNKQFNGTFEKVDEQKNIREEIKIKGGVRNGNTKTYDLLTGELIEKKKYKNGVVED